MDLDRVILGTNPLNGISHFSGSKAREKLGTLNNERVIQVIDASLSTGATGINLSPSTRLFSILNTMKKEGYARRFGVYLMLPDMERFRSAMLTGGTIAVAKELLSNLGWTDLLAVAAKGGLSMLLSDYSKLLQEYLELECRRLYSVLPRGGQLRCMLAHEQLTDLAIGLNADGVLKQFVAHAMKMGIMPGFVTRNFPLFVGFLSECGIDPAKLVIMTPFNSVGFQMTPDKGTCERLLSGSKSRIIGISTLAGGMLSLDAATNYLKTLSALRSVVVGVSSVEHATETMPKMLNALTA